MIDTWYYADKNRPVGPRSLADLTADLQKIPDWKNLLVWRNGFSEWQRAGRVKEILTLFAIPPPIPTDSASRPGKSRLHKSRSWLIVKILLGIAVLTATAAGGALWPTIVKDVNGFLTPASMATHASDLEKALADAAHKLQANLPKRIDATTTLMSVKYEAAKLIYENNIAMDGAKFDDAMKANLRQSVTKSICARGETRRVLELGGSFRYVYEDIEAKPVLTIDIARQNCS